MEILIDQHRYTKKRWAEKFRDMEKWEFNSIVSEEMITYVDNGFKKIEGF